MKTFVIGDVHGCCDALVELLEVSGIRLGEDRLVLLGDYIDRGSQEHQVLELLMHLRERYGSDLIIPLRGNHEQMLLDNLDSGYSWGCRFQKKELEFMRSLPICYQDDHWFFVHGGIDPKKKLTVQEDDQMLWIREECYLYSGKLEKKLVFGHTPTRLIHGKDEPVVWSDRIALDTGCVFGGQLSCLVIEDEMAKRIYSVPGPDPGKRKSAA